MGDPDVQLAPDAGNSTGAGGVDADDALVQVRDLLKHFPITSGVFLQKQVGAVQAVDGVSFDVRRGETLGIVGETGSGPIQRRICSRTRPAIRSATRTE